MADTTFSTGTVITSDWLNYVNDAVNELPQVSGIPKVAFRNIHQNFVYDYSTTTVVVRNGASDAYHRHFGGIAEGIDGRLHLVYRRALVHGVTDGVTIYYCYSDDGGSTWSAETELVAATAGYDTRESSICVTPSGRVIVAYDMVSAPTGPVTFRLRYSDDNGATWTQGTDIYTSSYAFARVYGRIKVIPGVTGTTGYRLCMTPYYQVSATPTYVVAAWYSSDDGLTWTAGTPIQNQINANSETEMVAINAKVWFAVARGTGLNLYKTTNAGGTWTLVGVIPTNDGVAPTLDKFIYNGKWYLLLGYCDRSSNNLQFKYAEVSEALSASTAFSNPGMVFETDMTNASGYQSVVTDVFGMVYLDGGLGYVVFKEYGGGDPQPLASEVRFVRQNIIQKCKDTNRSYAVASGAITVPALWVDETISLSCEGAAATDDLDTINGGVEGQVVTFRSNSSSQDITFKNGTGNLNIGSDFTLTTADPGGSRIRLVKLGTKWFQLARGT